MIEPRFRWQFPRGLPIEPGFAAAGDGHGLSPRLVELLWGRRVQLADLASFVAAPSAALCDPWLLPDAATFRDRIALARSRGERVLLFGDFDADGLTGLAILTLALRRLGVDVVPYVPDRIREGHGLSGAAIETAVAAGATVIVTVDCGTSSRDEVATATALGIDVLITDHHRVPPALPPALAIVNPQRADSRYPHRLLAGSGVAFKLAQLLLADVTGVTGGTGEATPAGLDFADLATIGTVADLAPVLGENRAIARIGLDGMRRAPRPGIAALLAAAGIDAARTDLETVAFAIAPRLNAAGRMGDARLALDLLLAEDADTAAGLAEALDAANVARRQLTREAIAEAETAIEAAAAAAPGAGTTGGAVVVRGPWPVGIVGLVASRLSERRGRPAVVGAQLEGFVRASCRTGPGFDLAAALESCADLLTRHGGHAGAAGFEVPDVAWDAFVERFQGLVGTAEPQDPRPALMVDLSLPGRDLDYSLVRDLVALEPTGPGNPAPLVAVLDLTVTRVRAANGGHAQLTLRRRIDVLDAIAFDRADLVETVREGDVVDVVARVSSRTFGGYESLQLEVRDVASAGTVRPAAVSAQAPEPALAGALA